MAGFIEAGQIAQLGDEGYRADQTDPSERLQGLDDRKKTPALARCHNRRFQAFDAAFMVLHGVQILGKGDLLSRMRHLQCRQPIEVGLTPFGLARIAEPLAQHKRIDLLLDLAQRGADILSGPNQVPKGVICLIRDIHRGQLSRSVKGRQVGRIAAIIFNPVSDFPGDQRRSYNDAIDPLVLQVPVKVLLWQRR